MHLLESGSRSVQRRDDGLHPARAPAAASAVGSADSGADEHSRSGSRSSVAGTGLLACWLTDAATDEGAIDWCSLREHSCMTPSQLSYDPWRICFRWKDGDALDVEIVDYHQET